MNSSSWIVQPTRVNGSAWPSNKTTSSSRLDNDLVLYLEKYYSLVLLVLGTVGNLLCLAVLSRKTFRRSSVGIYLRFLTFSDLTAIYTGVLFFTARSLFNLNFRKTDELSCKFHRWLSFTACDLSSWALVLVSSARLISIAWPMKRLITRRRVYISILLTVLVLLAANLPIFIMYGNVVDPHTNRTKACVFTEDSFESFYNYVFSWIVLFKFGFLPGVLLIVLNTALVMNVSRSGRAVDELEASPVNGASRNSSRVRSRLSGWKIRWSSSKSRHYSHDMDSSDSIASSVIESQDSGQSVKDDLAFMNESLRGRGSKTKAWSNILTYFRCPQHQPELMDSPALCGIGHWIRDLKKSGNKDTGVHSHGSYDPTLTSNSSVSGEVKGKEVKKCECFSNLTASYIGISTPPNLFLDSACLNVNGLVGKVAGSSGMVNEEPSGDEKMQPVFLGQVGDKATTQIDLGEDIKAISKPTENKLTSYVSLSVPQADGIILNVETDSILNVSAHQDNIIQGDPPTRALGDQKIQQCDKSPNTESHSNHDLSIHNLGAPLGNPETRGTIYTISPGFISDPSSEVIQTVYEILPPEKTNASCLNETDKSKNNVALVKLEVTTEQHEVCQGRPGEDGVSDSVSSHQDSILSEQPNLDKDVCDPTKTSPQNQSLNLGSLLVKPVNTTGIDINNQTASILPSHVDGSTQETNSNTSTQVCDQSQSSHSTLRPKSNTNQILDSNLADISNQHKDTSSKVLTFQDQPDNLKHSYSNSQSPEDNASGPSCRCSESSCECSGSILRRKTGLKRSRNGRRSTAGQSKMASKSRSLTRTLLVLNTVFLLCNTPITVYMTGKTYFWPDTDGYSASMDVFATIANFTMYTNNSINFILYCVTGSRFRGQLILMFRELYGTLRAGFRVLTRACW